MLSPIRVVPACRTIRGLCTPPLLQRRGIRQSGPIPNRDPGELPWVVREITDAVFTPKQARDRSRKGERRPKNGQKSRIPRKTRPDKGPGDSPGRDPGAGKIHRRVSRGNWLAPAPGSTGRNHCRRFPSMPKSTEGKRGRIPRGCRKPRHMQKEQNPGTRPSGFPHRSITPHPTAGVPCLEDTWHRRASQQPLARAPAV